MTDDGVLFVQEGLADRFEKEIRKEISDTGYKSTAFKLNGEGNPVPETTGGEWGNVEKRWPTESKIPIMLYGDRIGTLEVELESTVKQGIWNEYLGKDVVNHTITIQPRTVTMEKINE